MRDDGSAAYKTVRGLSRGLLLLKLLNKFDGGATPGLLAEFSGLHRTTVRRLLETLQEEGFVRRSRSDDSFRLTINVRQLSDGFRDEHWISALATPLLGKLLRSTVANGHHHPRRRRHGGARDYPPLQPTVVSPRDGRTAAAAAAHRLWTDVAGLCPRRGTRRRRQHAGRPSGS